MALTLPLNSTFMEEKEMYAKRFPSWEDFCSFFDGWCEQQRAVFSMRSSLSLINCKWTAQMRPEAIAALKYRYVRLVCKNASPPKNAAIRAQKVLCQASINLRLNEKKDHIIVSKCWLEHNHPLCPLEFAYYFKKGYLVTNSSLSVRTTNTISKQFVGRQDIKRLLISCKSDENGVLGMLKALENLFAHDPEAKVKMVFVEDQPRVRTVFIMTSLMRSLCLRFPTMLVFDRMVSLDGEFDLFVLLCVDDCGQGHEGVYCLTRKATSDLLRFTLVSFVQSVPDVKLKVRCLTVGMEIWDEKVVTELLPNAHVQIGRPQETLFSKAQEMGAPEDETVWPLLCALASASNMTAYTRTIKKMKTVFPSSFMEYFQEHWHPHRKMWLELWAFNTTQNVNASKVISQQQQQLVSCLSPSPPLGRGILDLVALQIIKAKHLNDEEVVTSYHTFYNPGEVKLIGIELSMAREGTYSVQGTLGGFSVTDGNSDFVMDQKLTSCSCPISTSSFVPCRHLFITRIRTGEALFDSNLLRKNRVAICRRAENKDLV